MPSRAKPIDSTPIHWTPAARMLVSILVALHLLAVFSAPWSAPPPSSNLARWIAGWFRPYAQAVSINNGYRFFAPEPGPSHLIRYELTSGDGSKITARFPDRKVHWPRLLYHRHFMLSEMTFNISTAVPELPPDVLAASVMSRQEEQEYRDMLRQSKLLQQSVADYLLSQYPQAQSVELFVQTHMIPTPFDVQRGIQLTDERSYEERSLGEFTRGQP